VSKQNPATAVEKLSTVNREGGLVPTGTLISGLRGFVKTTWKNEKEGGIVVSQPGSDLAPQLRAKGELGKNDDVGTLIARLFERPPRALPARIHIGEANEVTAILTVGLAAQLNAILEPANIHAEGLFGIGAITQLPRQLAIEGYNRDLIALDALGQNAVVIEARVQVTCLSVMGSAFSHNHARSDAEYLVFHFDTRRQGTRPCKVAVQCKQALVQSLQSSEALITLMQERFVSIDLALQSGYDLGMGRFLQ
jgi:hypothetical protein